MTDDGVTQTTDHLVAECRRIEEFAQANAAVHYVHAERAGLIAKILATVPTAMGAGLGAIVAFDPELTTAGAGHWFAVVAVTVAGVLSQRPHGAVAGQGTAGAQLGRRALQDVGKRSSTST